MNQHRTKIFITIDTECTEERLLGKKIRPPLGYSEMMWGRVGTPSELGIAMLVDELKKRNIAASFFVEALCTLRFGEEGLAEAIQFLVENGQDVQLHLHPNFERPEWRRTGAPAPEDNIGRLPLEEQRRLLMLGSAVLQRCGVNPTDLTAFRAGNYGASNDTLRVLHDLGFVVDASYNPCYLGSDCDIDYAEAPNDAFLHSSGIWELPVSNIVQPGGGFRHLEVTAISFAEMRWSLHALHAAGVRHISIVTHPGEFFSIDSVDPVRGRANRINLRRFQSILDFVSSNSDTFEFSTVGTLAKELGATKPTPTRSGPYPKVGMPLWLLRQGEQSMKRMVMSRLWG